MELLFKFIVFIIIFIFRRFLLNLPKLIYWKIIDFIRYDPKVFSDYGCWFFVGKQGSGKTMSLVETLERFRKKYPNVKIYTNFGYVYETAPLQKMTDLLDRSLWGREEGTIFVIDEIQNEFSSSTSKDFPESVLSLVTQQRKNHILILTTSQVFTRVSKPLREQAFRVIECKTLWGRYTMCHHYDGIDYADYFDTSTITQDKMRPCIKYHSFVQSDKIRSLYDSYKMIDRLSRVGFSPKVIEPFTSNVYISSENSPRKRSAR